MNKNSYRVDIFFRQINFFPFSLFGNFICRQTPFASGPNDTPSEILHRIAESKLDLRSGTWVTISNEAKVRKFDIRIPRMRRFSALNFHFFLLYFRIWLVRCCTLNPVIGRRLVKFYNTRGLRVAIIYQRIESIYRNLR